MCLQCYIRGKWNLHKIIQHVTIVNTCMKEKIFKNKTILFIFRNHK